MSLDELGVTSLDGLEIKNYEKVGRLIVQWMQQGLPIPPSGPIQVLIDALGGDDEVSLPDTFATYKILDGSDTEFRLRLPPPDLTKEGQKRACVDLDPDAEYKEPAFYKQKVCDKQMSHCNFFFCRVADYTMNMCK